MSEDIDVASFVVEWPISDVEGTEDDVVSIDVVVCEMDENISAVNETLVDSIIMDVLVTNSKVVYLVVTSSFVTIVVERIVSDVGVTDNDVVSIVDDRACKVVEIVEDKIINVVVGEIGEDVSAVDVFSKDDRVVSSVDKIAVDETSTDVESNNNIWVVVSEDIDVASFVVYWLISDVGGTEDDVVSIDVVVCVMDENISAFNETLVDSIIMEFLVTNSKVVYLVVEKDSDEIMTDVVGKEDWVVFAVDSILVNDTSTDVVVTVLEVENDIV